MTVIFSSMIEVIQSFGSLNVVAGEYQSEICVGWPLQVVGLAVD